MTFINPQFKSVFLFFFVILTSFTISCNGKKHNDAHTKHIAQKYAWGCNNLVDAPVIIWIKPSSAGYGLGVEASDPADPTSWGAQTWQNLADVPQTGGQISISGETWIIIKHPYHVDDNLASKHCSAACSYYCENSGAYFDGNVLPPGTKFSHCGCMVDVNIELEQ